LPEWLIEHGIGESRAVLVDRGAILEARVMLEGVVPAGSVLAGRLTQVGRPALATCDGQEYLLPKGAGNATQGSIVTIEVTREKIGGSEPWKRPLAKLVDAAPTAAPVIDAEDIAFPSSQDLLEEAGWSELIEEARTGVVPFPGGELRVFVTPAMTLVDVDGTLPPQKLSIAGAKAAAMAIRRHGVGGNIGIDLPVEGGKAGRLEAASAVDALLPQPFERTAVNGFGFLQIIRPRRHASLFELAAEREPFEARALLRNAARSVRATRLFAHPRVIAVLEARGEWTDRLARQVGGAISLCPDPSIAISGGYAKPA
jgi:hypothetical protein